MLKLSASAVHKRRSAIAATIGSEGTFIGNAHTTVARSSKRG